MPLFSLCKASMKFRVQPFSNVSVARRILIPEISIRNDGFADWGDFSTYFIYLIQSSNGFGTF